MHSAASVANAVQAKHFAVLARSIRIKTISRRHYALSVCAAAAMLAGCGASARSPNPTAFAPVANSRVADRLGWPSYAVPERVGSGTSSTERLTGTAKLSRCTFRTRFRARGVATGPNPGTFTATGGWGIDFPPDQQVWFFHESFIITSGSQTIDGHIDASGSGSAPFSCTAVKNDIFPYSTPMVRGNAKINIWSGHFREGLLSF
jgi:hypothetical protein